MMPLVGIIINIINASISLSQYKILQKINKQIPRFYANYLNTVKISEKLRQIRHKNSFYWVFVH